jgi:hypothetical protein
MPTRGLFVGVRCLLMFLTEIIINVDNKVPFKYKLQRNLIECFMISFWLIKVFLCLLQMKARNGWFGTSTNWKFHDPFTMLIWNMARLYIPSQNSGWQNPSLIPLFHQFTKMTCPKISNYSSQIRSFPFDCI